MRERERHTHTHIDKYIDRKYSFHILKDDAVLTLGTIYILGLSTVNKPFSEPMHVLIYTYKFFNCNQALLPIHLIASKLEQIFRVLFTNLCFEWHTHLYLE